MEHYYPMTAKPPEPTLVLSAPILNLDVSRHTLDPFISGFAVGVLATLVGMVIGWFV